MTTPLEEYVADLKPRDRLKLHISVGLFSRRTDHKIAADAAVMIDNRMIEMEFNGEELQQQVEEAMGRFKAWENRKCNRKKIADSCYERIVWLLDRCGFKKAVSEKMAKSVMLYVQLEGKDLSKTKEFEDFIIDRLVVASKPFVKERFKY